MKASSVSSVNIKVEGDADSLPTYAQEPVDEFTPKATPAPMPLPPMTHAEMVNFLEATLGNTANSGSYEQSQTKHVIAHLNESIEDYKRVIEGATDILGPAQQRLEKNATMMQAQNELLQHQQREIKGLQSIVGGLVDQLLLRYETPGARAEEKHGNGQ